MDNLIYEKGIPEELKKKYFNLSMSFEDNKKKKKSI